MGKVRFLVFYLLSGIAATALQTVVTLAAGSDMAAAVPNLGASGAVSGVLGAYLVLLPNARGADARLLLPPRGAGLPLPRLLVPVPALGGRVLAHAAGGRRRRRVLRAHGRLRLRGGYRSHVQQAPAVATGLLMEPRSSRSTFEPRSTRFPRRSHAASRTSPSWSRTRALQDPGILGSFFGYPHGAPDAFGRPAGEGRRLPAAARGGVPRPGRARAPDPVTVLHELAHYFGIDEDRIAELGYR